MWLLWCWVCPLIRSQIPQGLMCNSRGLLCLPSPANTSRSGREIRLAHNQICYQIRQFLDLVNVCLARNEPVWAQRGSADEVTENQPMYSLIQTHPRKRTLWLYLSYTHKDDVKKSSHTCSTMLTL